MANPTVPERPGSGWISIRPGKIITAADSPYTVPPEMAVVGCDCSAGPITVQMDTSSAFKGRVISVKKIDVSINAVTVLPAGSELIDRAVNTVFAVADVSVDFYARPDGLGWFRL